jgi:hypothetical protein
MGDHRAWRRQPRRVYRVHQLLDPPERLLPGEAVGRSPDHEGQAAVVVTGTNRPDGDEKTRVAHGDIP